MDILSQSYVLSMLPMLMLLITYYDLKVSSFQCGLSTSAHISVTPESRRLLLLRSSSVRLENCELRTSDRASQHLSERLQPLRLKKKKIHAAFIKDNIRQYLHAVQEVKVKVVADYCDLRWNTETTKMQKHENDADLIFFSVLIDYIYQLRKWECWLIWPESFHFTLWAFHSNREKLYTWILQVVVTQV